jgi:stromal membrane-associated protein
MNDAFSSLSFGNPAQPKSPQNDAFASLGGFGGSRPAAAPAPSNNSAFSNLSGGSFFDAKPAASAPAQQPPKQSFGGSSGFGGFGGAAAAPAPAPASSGLGDLFDFSTPAAPPTAPAAKAPASNATSSSVFNLSAPQSKPAPAPAAANPVSAGGNTWGSSDVWGGNAWATPEAPKKAPEPAKPAAGTAANNFGWGSSPAASNPLANQSIVPGASGGFAPQVAADEEFGGWASNTTPAATSGGTTGKSGQGFGTSEDLFSNVWQ